MKKINSADKLLSISNISRISFRNDINGLRAVAVLSVVFYHAEITAFKGGWLGVDMFFVISGFLISNIIISELNNNSFKFKNFYLKRVKRILPALFSTVLLSIPFAYFLFSPKAMTEFVDSAVATVFFFANYYFQTLDFYVAESTKYMPLLHTWSLAIEEQFYLLFPLVTVLIYKYLKKHFTLIILLLTFLSLFINTLTSGTFKFYYLQYRAWEFFLGVLLMIVSSKLSYPHLDKLGLPLLLFPLFYFDDSWINDLEPKLITLTGISLFLFSNKEDSITSKILNLKILRNIGLSSYSIYLFHQPLFAFYRVFLNKNFLYFNDFTSSVDILNGIPNIINGSLEVNAVFFLVIVLLVFGVLSYKFIEKNNYLLRIILLNLIFLTIFFFLQNKNTYVYSMRFSSNDLLSNESVFSDYGCWGTFDNWEDKVDFLDICYFENGVENNLIFMGDSSTATLAKHFTKNEFFDNNFNYLFLTTSYKSFFQNIDFEDSCKDCVSSFFKKENKNTIVLSLELHRYLENKDSIYFSSSYFLGDKKNVLYNNIINLANNSEKIYIIEPYPTMLDSKPSPVDILMSRGGEDVNEIYISLTDWEANTQYISKFLQSLENKSQNVHVLRTKNLFCEASEDKCFVFRDSEIYYLDRFHLSMLGSSKLINPLLEVIKSK